MTPEHRVVAIDVDGVLADFMCGFTDLARRLGYRIEPRSNATAQEYAMASPVEYTAITSIAGNLPGFWRYLPSLLTDRDRLALRALFRCTGRIDPYFVTSRFGRFAHNETAAWLERELDVPRANVIVTRKTRAWRWRAWEFRTC